MSLAAALQRRILPVNAIRERVMERVRRRRGSKAPPYTLEYRHIYILPTPFGVGFGAMLVFMALGGLNFNNNLALLMVFLMGSVAQMTTMVAYRNLVGLDVLGLRADPVFAGDTAHFLLDLRNPDSRHRFTVEGSLADEGRGDCIDLPPGASDALKLDLEARSRGWLQAPPLRVETRFPLGMFRAWTWIFPDHRCLVYPTPAQSPPPLPTSGAGVSGEARRGEGDQVHSLRNYRDGDPLKRIAWRSSARHGQLLTREMETPRESSCELDFDRLTGMDTEQRLSVLTAWVLMADHRQLSYSLSLPGARLPTDQGMSHRDRCLEALALV